MPVILVGNEAEGTGADRGDAVVQNLQVQALQVGDVAGHVKRRDLALALGGDLVDAGEAFQDQAALGRAVADAHDVPIRLVERDLHREAVEGLPLLVGQGKDALQLADHQAVGSFRIDHHGGFPMERREDPQAATTAMSRRTMIQKSMGHGHRATDCRLSS
jgi:hypothetical protein